ETQDISSTEAVLRKPVFREGLVWTGSVEPPPAESARLLAIISNLSQPTWTSEVETFLHDYPNSPWAASLHHAYASFCRRTGRTTKALTHWEGAWDLLKSDTSERGKRVGGAVLASWTDLLSSLGRVQKLQELVQAGDHWSFV